MLHDQEQPVWFITGCSTGFGRELATQVLDRGWRAVVSARNPDSIADFEERYGERVLAARLDVTNPALITTAVNTALARFGGIDVLVNNAGYGYIAAVEEGEDGEIREMFETNVFGLAALIREVLPDMRARRSGTIVNIASVAGLIGSAGSGYYAATKFAIVGMSESLSKELAPLGLRVMIVEPGPFRTNWAGRSLRLSQISIDDYEQTVRIRRRQLSAAAGKRPGDPVRGAAAIIQAVLSDRPPLNLVLGKVGLETTRAKLQALTSDLETWENVSLAADFPE